MKFIMEWMLKLNTCGSYETIRLVALTLEQDKDFVPFTRNALDLIKRADSRRYRRMLGEIRYIVNSHIQSAGAYQRATRRISVNFSLYKADPTDSTYDLHLALYAAMLVHEVTHARLFSHGIPYNDHTWKRCESICLLEVRRFLFRVKPDNYDLTQMPDHVDLKYYRAIRGVSALQKLKSTFEFLSQVFPKKNTRNY